MANAGSLKAPFPYAGGKSAVADDVWEALGEVDHYIEPFFGSGAVLLARPGFAERGGEWTETVNDADGFIANVWRAIQFDPDETAKWCDWPVNHVDLIARKRELIEKEAYLLEGLAADPKWHDAELAGYWVWAASCWIGSGLTCPKQNQVPQLSHKGMGVHKSSLFNCGQVPHLSDKGKGIHAASKTGAIYEWMAALSARLRRVRVVCGDWSQVCGGDWQAGTFGTCGIFCDPPYSAEAGRYNGIYHKESLDVAHKVREWSLERGERPEYRIVLAGYFEEHADLIDHGWTVKKWSAGGGYANAQRKEGSKAKGKENRHKEALFFSPHCLDFALFS